MIHTFQAVNHRNYIKVEKLVQKKKCSNFEQYTIMKPRFMTTTS